MDSYKIGVFIAERRKKTGLTQKQLAERLGVTDKTVSCWERGKYMPDISLLIPLSEQLNISVGELLKGGKTDYREIVHDISSENSIKKELSEENVSDAPQSAVKEETRLTIRYAEIKQKETHRKTILLMALAATLIIVLPAMISGFGITDYMPLSYGYLLSARIIGAIPQFTVLAWLTYAIIHTVRKPHDRLKLIKIIPLTAVAGYLFLTNDGAMRLCLFLHGQFHQLFGNLTSNNGQLMKSVTLHSHELESYVTLTVQRFSILLLKLAVITGNG